MATYCCYWLPLLAPLPLLVIVTPLLLLWLRHIRCHCCHTVTLILVADITAILRDMPLLNAMPRPLLLLLPLRHTLVISHAITTLLSILAAITPHIVITPLIRLAIGFIICLHYRRFIRCLRQAWCRHYWSLWYATCWLIMAIDTSFSLHTLLLLIRHYAGCHIIRCY